MSFVQNNSSEKTSVQVAVRIRPLNKKEHDTDVITTVVYNDVLIRNPDDRKKKTFGFDYVFDTASEQIELYEEIGEKVIDNAFKGYNSCVFAYGQTGCFALDTKIRMLDSSVKSVQDIQADDMVMGDNGTGRKVLQLFKGNQKMYDVSDVEAKLPTYTVNLDHIMVIFSEGKIQEIPIKNMDLSKQYIGLRSRKDERTGLYIIEKYNIKIKAKKSANFYGFMLDGNHRFQHESGIILRNSGKTHTMMGGDTELDTGIIPRICQELFNKQLTMPNNATITYKVEISYLEIYSEEVRDLLNKTNRSLKVREHPELGPYVEGISQVLVLDYQTISKLLDQGNKERTTASTNMNNKSSRSHAILTMYFTQLIDDPNIGKMREVVSKINLVDLAGSEKVEMSGVTGINFKEAININKSLSTLGLVISKLAAASQVIEVAQPSSASHHKSGVPNSRSPSPSGNNRSVHASSSSNSIYNKSKSPAQPPKLDRPSSADGSKSKKSPSPVAKKPDHVPFRDSVLTWILKESLGGNSKTYMIATISPSAVNYNESLSTLRYASNAKQIVNMVKINEDPSDKLIRVLQNEIEQLKRQVNIKGSDSTTSFEELKGLKDELTQREELMKEKDKSWEQKLEDSKRIYAAKEQQIIREYSEELNKHHEELIAKQAEMDNLMRKMESMKSGMSDSSVETQRIFQEEMNRRQADFEKGRIVDTAVSLQKYYDDKLSELKNTLELEYKNKHPTNVNTDEYLKLQELYKELVIKHNKLQAEYAKLQDNSQKMTAEYAKLQAEISRCQIQQQQQSKQYSGERLSNSKQIQQLTQKVQLLEQELENKNLDIQSLPDELRAKSEMLSATRKELANSNKTLTDNSAKLTMLTEEIADMEAKHLEIRQKLLSYHEDSSVMEKTNRQLIAVNAHIKQYVADLSIKLDTQLELAKERLKNPTIDEILSIKTRISSLFELDFSALENLHNLTIDPAHSARNSDADSQPVDNSALLQSPPQLMGYATPIDPVSVPNTAGISPNSN